MRNAFPEIVVMALVPCNGMAISRFTLALGAMVK